MKLYVSSTFVDLREHREAAIRVLRQLGHQVVAMEDYVADAAVPLKKVLEDVASVDAYVGIFAWRYGYVPGAPAGTQAGPAVDPPVPPPGVALPPNGKYGSTSITEWEYLQAKAKDLSILAFLLEEGVPWPPHLCDGAAPGTVNASIQRLRRELTEERLVSYFDSPADLGQRVSTAVTVTSMSRQMGINLLTPTVDGLQMAARGGDIQDSGKTVFTDAVVANQSARVVRIDIGSEWWSTRLYLLAFMLGRLTDVRRVLVEASPDPAKAEHRPAKFVALLSTDTIERQIGPMHPQIALFQTAVQTQPSPPDLNQAATALVDAWSAALPVGIEQGIQTRVTEANLKRWFSDSMLSRALLIPDLASASPFDIARLIDYPSDFVPITTFERPAARSTPLPTTKVVDKAALEAQLARTYLSDLLSRVGVRL